MFVPPPRHSSTQHGYFSYITDDECRAELSFPDVIKDQVIIGWAERIFVPTDELLTISKDLEDEDSDIDVPVRLKA